VANAGHGLGKGVSEAGFRDVRYRIDINVTARSI
jgi:hypothetical protein